MHFKRVLTSKLFQCFLFTNMFCISSIGQLSTGLRQLKQKLGLADSVQIISHGLTEEYTVIQEQNPNEKSYENARPVYKFLRHRKINLAIVKESLTLSYINRSKLINVLCRNVDTKAFTPTKCDEPRHTIIIYKKRRQSYIDICFHCKRIHTSKDIIFTELYFDTKKWNDLEEFFRTYGLTIMFKENNE